MTRPKFRPCPACQTPNQRSRKTCSACYGSLSNKTKLKEKAASLNSEWGQGVVKNRNVGRIIDSACIAVRKLEALGYKPILFYGKPKRASNMWAADIITYLPPTPATKTLLDKMRRAYEFLLAKELPQQHVCNEDEVLTDQQLCGQERNSSLDQEDPEPPQIKEEQEELCTRQEEEQLELKQETDVFMVTLTDEESVHSGQTCAKESVDKPQIKLHRTELPQQHVCNEEEVLTDQQLCSQERNSSLDQEDPEPPQIKEEQEELCTRQEEEQLQLKQETDVFMVTLTDEESVHSGQTCAKESVGNMPVISVVVSEVQSNLQLISHNSNDSGLTRTADPVIDKMHHKTKRNNVNNANLSDMQRNTYTVKKKKM
ncbi:putative uncharacterized protein DDB_G0287113 isoform X1 [Gymnodraco acuticeps]|uniref:Uncharacterized protein n=1 Tax=Gymnodraco acuticeps TaxID=8218 RepID=A0A6P8WYI4_GYMAC|nr:putative uncharacterized protein DDB_G0287113 isoform X1 [Gymnodraco acuticeps]